jgi:hypothetical protein
MAAGLPTLVVVDGSNLYNDAARHLATACPESKRSPLRKKYLMTWFDVDRLISATLQPYWQLFDYRGGGLGTVILHSGKSLGSSKTGSELVEDELLVGSELTGNHEVSAFWARQSSAPSTSAMLVEWAGSKGGKETGVDTSIVVHLFETMDSWEAAVLFTNDADLVPAVWSLRRRGKRVYCSSPADPMEHASRPLIKASQSFFRWDLDFLTKDWLFFEFLQPGGPLDQFFDKPEGVDFDQTWRGRSGHGFYLGRPVDASTVTLDAATTALSLALPPGFRARADQPCIHVSWSEGHTGGVLDGMDRHARSLSARWISRWVSPR